MAKAMAPTVAFDSCTSRTDKRTVALDLNWEDTDGQTYYFTVKEAKRLRAELDAAIELSES